MYDVEGIAFPVTLNHTAPRCAPVLTARTSMWVGLSECYPANSTGWRLTWVIGTLTVKRNVLLWFIDISLGKWRDRNPLWHQGIQHFSDQEPGACGNKLLHYTFWWSNLFQAEFARLSGETKTAFKWRWFLKPLKLSLALLLPTAENRNTAGSTFSHKSLLSPHPLLRNACGRCWSWSSGADCQDACSLTLDTPELLHLRNIKPI